MCVLGRVSSQVPSVVHFVKGAPGGGRGRGA